MPDLIPQSTRARVLSGMRPTGRLHLGNYMGALYNWVQLQNRRSGADQPRNAGQPEFDCFFFIADLHALTTGYADTSEIKENSRQVILDFLAAGLDPGRTVLFRQSHVPAHDQLNTLLGMFTPVPWLERVPTYKDQQEQLREKDLATFGFLGYPLLQSADILLYQPEFVPVGADQVSHVELTREVARRFNQLYPGAFTLSPDAAPWELEAIKTRARKLSGNKIQEHFTPHQLLEAAHQTKKLSPYKLTEILPEPQVLLTPSPKLPGLDGRKMSKSYGNTITLSEPVADLRAKLKTMVTDPARVRRDDPGNPEVCPVGDLHKVFSPLDTQAEVWKGCTTAAIGCIECKGWLADNIVLTLGPIQQRRSEFERQPAFVDDILADGANRARARAAQTIAQVHHVMGLD
jgi:tryptophanyl-tRNA synthetase